MPIDYIDIWKVFAKSFSFTQTKPNTKLSDKEELTFFL